MLTAIALSVSVAPAASDTPQPPPAMVSDVVAGAIKCFEAVASKNVVVSRLTEVGWVELLDAKGNPETPGGHVYRRAGVGAEIAVVGSVCSLVASVRSFDDVKATLLQLDDAIHPDKIEKNDHGILLKKGSRSIMFFVGDVTNQKPAAVRIDAEFSETQ